MAPSIERDHAGERPGRIGVFDVARGAAVISMVLFHLCYDLAFIGNVELPWFSSPLLDVWRASISWTFLFVAGCMCPLSRSNLRRALQYGAVALLICGSMAIYIFAARIYRPVKSVLDALPESGRVDSGHSALLRTKFSAQFPVEGYDRNPRFCENSGF